MFLSRNSHCFIYIFYSHQIVSLISSLYECVYFSLLVLFCHIQLCCFLFTFYIRVSPSIALGRVLFLVWQLAGVLFYFFLIHFFFFFFFSNAREKEHRSITRQFRKRQTITAIQFVINWNWMLFFFFITLVLSHFQEKESTHGNKWNRSHITRYWIATNRVKKDESVGRKKEKNNWTELNWMHK